MSESVLICEGPQGGFRVVWASAREDPVGRALPALGAPRAALEAARPFVAPIDSGRELAACPLPPDAPPLVWLARLAGRGAGPIDEAIIDDLPVALVLFDSADRMVWFNEPYRRLLGPNAHLLKLGDTFESIMAAAYRAGHGAGDASDVEARIAERLARHRACETFEEALSGGRRLLTEEIALTRGILGVRTQLAAAG